MKKNQEVQKIQNKGNKTLKCREFTTKYGALLVFLTLLVINLIITPNFFSTYTIWNIIIQSTPTIIAAMGMTFVIAIGGIDISIGSSMALCTITISLMMSKNYSIGICVIVGLLIGLGLGMLIGVLTIKFDIQPMVLTLAFMIMLRSASRITCNDKSVQIVNDTFTNIALKRFDMIPIQTVYVIVVVGIFYILGEYTIFGKYVEAIGNNSTGAKISGIRSDMISISTYALLGVLVSVSGLLTVARSMNCNPSSFGSGMEMEAIAAVVIGGTSMTGGKPRILGTTIGCFIMTLITMTVNMNGVPSSYSMIIKAAIIVMAVYLQSDKVQRKKKLKLFLKK